MRSDGRHRRLHDGVFGREVADRHEEALHVLDERHQRAEGERAAEDLAAAVPDDHRERERADRLDDREQRRLVDVRGVVGDAELVVQPVEAALTGALAGKQLDDRHARQRFLEIGVEARQAVADVAVVAPRRDAKDVDHHRQHRRQRQRDQRQPPVDGEHDGDDAEQRGDIHQDGQRTGGEHLVDDVDVGGHARHQAADRIAVEERAPAAPAGARPAPGEGRRGCAGRPPSSARTAGR